MDVDSDCGPKYHLRLATFSFTFILYQTEIDIEGYKELGVQERKTLYNRFSIGISTRNGNYHIRGNCLPSHEYMDFLKANFYALGLWEKT